MPPQKRPALLLIILLGILFLVLSCARTEQDEGSATLESINGQSNFINTPIPSITPIPTNRVKIDDQDIPLPPMVIQTYPSGGEEISENGIIEIVFDQAMDQNTTSAALSIQNNLGEMIEGNISWPDQLTLRFSPKQPLSPGLIYGASLSSSAKNIEGVNLSDSFQFEIRVAGELMVSQVFPADGTQDVEANSVITVVFNRPVVPLKIKGESENLPNPISTIPIIKGKGEWLNSSVYIFHPLEPLRSSTTYEVKVIAGLEDTIGSKLTKTYSWEFGTAAPSIQAFGIYKPMEIMNPKDNYEDVRPDSSFYINFQQPMDEVTVEETFSLTEQGGQEIEVEFDWTSPYQIIITPTQRLALGSAYELLLTENSKSSTGGKLLEGLRWDFVTIPLPGVESTDPKDGTTQSSFTSRFSIYFESPIDLETIEDHVIIVPSPGDDLSWYYNAWGWNVDFFGLDPSTNYSITVLPGIKDIYGNSLKDEYKFRFRTSELRPSAYLDLPYGPSIYTLGESMRFFLSYANVSIVESVLYRLPIEYFVGFENGTYNRWNFNPPPEWEVNYWSWENDKNINEITRRGVHLTDLGGDSLDPGFYLLTIDSPQVSKSGRYVDTRLLIVAEANLTVKTTPSEALIWLTDLESGKPIENSTIEIFNETLEQVGIGATNSQGLLYLELPVEEEIYRSRYIKTGANAPFAFAVSNWGSGVSPYDFGIWSNYYTLPSQPTAYVYTDRPLYRPGQIVNFKGILRQNDDLNYNLLPWEEVIIEISSFNEVVFQDTLELSEFGSFNGNLNLDENAALGYYSISVYDPVGEETIGGVGFSVAEYRKPEFQVTTEVSQEDLLVGEDYQIDIRAEYYSGGSVGDADVIWAIQSVDYRFQPSGEISRYTFMDEDRDIGFPFDDYQQVSREIIAEGETKTNSDGYLSLSLNADLQEEKNSRTFIFEATVTDVAGASVSDRIEYIIHRAALYPGIMPEKYIGKVGDEQVFNVVVVDWDGKTVPEAGVSLEIVERRWYSVQEQDSQGLTQWKTTVEEIPIASYQDVQMDANGEANVSFTPENGGIYKGYVIVEDTNGNQAKSAAYMWISSNDYIAWRQTNDRLISLVPDKDGYQPGEIAEIMIASPFTEENFALISTERGHIQDYDVLRLMSNSAIYRLPITSEMAPNIYVSVIIIQGADKGKPDFTMGMVELKVNPKEHEVKVNLSTDLEKTGPGESVTYHVRTTDQNDNPVQAEVSLALVDLSVLSLLGSNSQPILDYFYSGRSLGVRTTVPIVYNIEHYISSYEDWLTEGEGMGSGGGKGADVYGVFDIRGEFKDTAYWEANLLTDENGEASVQIKLPDNLTIWRMDARAVTKDTKVGENELDLRSTKPLFVRPQTPRFFVNGDQSVIGAVVQNNTNDDLDVRVSLVASGMNITSPQMQDILIPHNEQVFVTWDVSILNGINRVDLVITAKSGSYSDASRPTTGTLEDQGIPVYRYEVLETVGSAGTIPESGSRTETIYLPKDFDLSQGDLKIELSPSLIAGMVKGLDYLKHNSYECTEQTISKFLPNVLTKKVVDQAGIENFASGQDLDEQINLATQKLYNWQRPDGGWGWWPEAAESDPLTTGYVVLGLVEADKAGYQVNKDTLKRGVYYLKGSLISPGSFEQQFMINRQTFLLYVLAQAGEPQVSLTNVMLDHREKLSTYAKAFLAETLWYIDEEDPRLGLFISDFINSSIHSATGVHWEEEWHDYWNWNSDTRTTAIVLSAMLKIDPDNPLNANIVRWLMSNRTKGIWRTTQETAWTLISLARWLDITDELNTKYEWAVGVNGERLGDGSVNQENITETKELVKDVGELSVNEPNRLTIARDEGSGILYYASHLNLYLPVDQIQSLDRGIIISREYFKQEFRGDPKPVVSAKQGDLLLARLTLIVPNDLHYVVIDDPLPAGFEAVDPSLETNPDITSPSKYDFEGIWEEGWGWWNFDHIEYRDEKVLISADFLPAGTYVYTYIVRASTPGIYYTIPPIAQEFYFPEVYGRGDGMQFRVLP